MLSILALFAIETGSERVSPGAVFEGEEREGKFNNAMPWPVWKSPLETHLLRIFSACCSEILTPRSRRDCMISWASMRPAERMGSKYQVVEAHSGSNHTAAA